MPSTIKTDTVTYKPNYKNKTDGLLLLKELKDDSIAAAFFDPQHRRLLDTMKYGNEGRKRGQARCSLPQMTEETIAEFIKEIDRVLKPSGHLFLWVDKIILCESIHPWLEGTRFKIVDLVTWDKEVIGQGWRTRRRCEYLIILQKTPKRVKGVWTDHTIPDVWTEKVIKSHPHSKPIELQKRLIEAVTEEGDFILDPAAGGYSVFEAAKLCNRNFIGGDIKFGDEPPTGPEFKSGHLKKDQGTKDTVA